MQNGLLGMERPASPLEKDTDQFRQCSHELWLETNHHIPQGDRFVTFTLSKDKDERALYLRVSYLL